MVRDISHIGPTLVAVVTEPHHIDISDLVFASCALFIFFPHTVYFPFGKLNQLCNCTPRTCTLLPLGPIKHHLSPRNDIFTGINDDSYRLIHVRYYPEHRTVVIILCTGTGSSKGTIQYNTVKETRVVSL